MFKGVFVFYLVYIYVCLYKQQVWLMKLLFRGQIMRLEHHIFFFCFPVFLWLYVGMMRPLFIDLLSACFLFSLSICCFPCFYAWLFASLFVFLFCLHVCMLIKLNRYKLAKRSFNTGLVFIIEIAVHSMGIKRASIPLMCYCSVGDVLLLVCWRWPNWGRCC